MKYITRLKGYLTDNMREILGKLGVEIIFESIFLPVIGIKTSNSQKVRDLDFVENIRKPRKGIFEKVNNIQCFNKLDNTILIKNNMLGWGDTRICIIDSGVNDGDGNVKIVEHKDFTGNGESDVKIHGTIVAKILRNFAKGAKLYSAKIGDYKPDELLMLDALQWACGKGAKIINISAGFDKADLCDETCDLCQTVNIISKMGVAIVVAAGNNNNKLNSVVCPAIASDSVAVGAVAENKKIASYSSFGKVGGKKPNVVAPGNIMVDGTHYSGTSFSTPIISGILGAILNTVGNVNNAIEYIYDTADDLNLPFHQQGKGCVNLENLIPEVLGNEKKSYFESKI